MRACERIGLCVLGIAIMSGAEEVDLSIDLSSGQLANHWEAPSGSWVVEDGVLRQQNVREHPARLYFAKPMLTDFVFEVSFRIAPTSRSVRAADFLFRAVDTANCLYFHCNSDQGMVALARSRDRAFWTEAKRTRDVGLTPGEWHQARIVGTGDTFTFSLDGEEVATATNDGLAAGCLGVGSCSAQVAFKDIRIRGTVAQDVPAFTRGPTWHARVYSGSVSEAPVLAHADADTMVCRWRTEEGQAMQARSSDQGMNWSPAEPADGRLPPSAPTMIQGERGALAVTPEIHIRRRPAGADEWLVSPEPVWPGSDPVLAGSAGDSVYLFVTHGDRGLHVLRTFDIGATWQGPIIVADDAGGPADALELADGSWLVAHSADAPPGLVVSRIDVRGPQILPVPVGLPLPERANRDATMTDGSVVVAPARPRVNPRNTEGSIVELKDGSLLLAYTRFYGGGSDHAYADISGMRSTDGGRTWGRPFLLQRNDAGCNVMSATLLRLQSGEILFGYLRKNEPRDDCRFYVRFSTDEGRTWSPDVCATPEPVEYYVVNNDRVIQLSNGRLLVPAADHADWKRRRSAWAICYLSDDNGRTWRRGNGHVELPGVGCQEPGVVDLGDGRVLMIIRNSLGSIYQAISEDGGDTWGEPTSMELASPTAPATIKRIPSTGDLLLVWNHSETRRRVPLTAAISRDNGQTWANIKDIEPDGRSFAYTSICFVDDAAVMTYWTALSGGLSLKVRRTPISWFYE